MKFFTRYLGLLCIVASCSLGEHKPTMEEKASVLQNSTFDKNLLKDLSQYNSLINTIRKNLDSITHYSRGKRYSKPLDSIFHLIETEQLAILKESERTLIRFAINRYKRQNNIIECHFLYWQDKPGAKIIDSFDFIKDTIADRNYVYRIGIATDNSGH